MKPQTKSIYFQYWGKSQKADTGEIKSHPLALHSLDVALVAGEWWNSSPALSRSFVQETGFSEKQTLGLVQLFIALHDFGKWDLRFQNKVPDISPCSSAKVDNRGYDHGPGGFFWFIKESDNILKGCSGLQQRCIQSWMAHTAGHHGIIPQWDGDKYMLPSYVPPEIRNQDSWARKQFIQDMIALFLKPNDIYLKSINLPETPPVLLAGFCAVCDWLGSHTDYFTYATPKEIAYAQEDLFSYLESRKGKAQKILKDFGFSSRIISVGGMNKLYPNLKLRGIQKLIDGLQESPGLTIMEASTGSGKTESAIAFATKLLAKGFADSITFALPTQGTANAILPRLKNVAEKIFSAGQNVILAHGNSPYNAGFKELIKKSQQQKSGEGNQAGAQCHEWLALSRKRAFLGQIAVTTVDQVLLSAIKPLKHHFVRSFGIGKSVLIIDEVHAYSAYMYGLLKEVLRQQKRAGGSVILLSATLSFDQKNQLLQIWDQDEWGPNDYPLILQIYSSEENKNSFVLCASTLYKKEAMESSKKEVLVELWSNNDMVLEDNHIQQITSVVLDKKVKAGLICNLVDDAQNIAQALKKKGAKVDIFHSRYRYKDRMEKEIEVLQKYGKNSQIQSRILVGTQVLEQSLDIDFDWLVTFLCPADLLFQRMGRLHRHSKSRSRGFEKALCSIILPEKKQYDYKAHGKYIYQNLRALWRTQQLLYNKRYVSRVTFPSAYRIWIEKVYQEEAWKHEPEDITKAFEKYKEDCLGSEYTARSLTQINSFFTDTDGHVGSLTREGEMNLGVIPIVKKHGDSYFLEGDTKVPLEQEKDKKQWEALYQNTIPVPAGWGRLISGQERSGSFYFLTMEKEEDKNRWLSEMNRGVQFCYTMEYGLQKLKLI